MRTRVLTTAAVAVALVAAAVQYTVPAAIPALQRDPVAGGWWRVVTSLFVQTLGWYQVVTNLVTLAFVGAVVERHLGRVRWVVLFVAGAAGGQFAAYATDNPGGGDSIAICGLAGGAVVWLLAKGADRWSAGVVAGYVAALTGWGFGGLAVAAAAAAAAGVVVLLARQLALAGAVACAAVLATVGDLHGISLLAGLLAGLAVMPAWRRPAGTGPVVTGSPKPTQEAPRPAPR
jgi:membrane associated rhomboid family serine protease